MNQFLRGAGLAAALLAATVAVHAQDVQFNEVAPAQLARMRDVVRPVVAKMTASYDPSLVKLYDTELAKARQ